MPGIQARGTHAFDPASSTSHSATDIINAVNAEEDGEELGSGGEVALEEALVEEGEEGGEVRVKEAHIGEVAGTVSVGETPLPLRARSQTS